MSSRYVFLKKVLGMPFMHAMEILFYFIEVGIKDVEKGCVWRFFGVYASTDDRIRRNQWQALRTRILTCQEAVMIGPRSKEEILGLKGMTRGRNTRTAGQGVWRGLLDWKRREWKNSQLCIDELRLELRAEYQNDIFNSGKVKELEFKLQKALVGKVKELEFKFKISHIFREGNYRVDALANHDVQGSGFTW
ncbi:unnamed protein product [Prunus armeniaca]